MAGDKECLIPKRPNTEETSRDLVEGVSNVAFSASNENVTSIEDTKKPIFNEEFLKDAILNDVGVSFNMEATSIQESSSDSPAHELQVVRNPQLKEPQFVRATTIYSAVRHIGSSGPEEQRVVRSSPKSFWNTQVPLLREFTRSWVMIPLLLVILAWHCSYIYFGLTYLHECNFLKYFPILYVFMGVSGVAAVVSRIFRNFMRMYPRMFNGNTCSFCRHLTDFGVFFFTIVYCVVGLIYINTSGKPTLAPGGPSYCSTVFYIFNEWNMLVVILLGFILLIYYSPTLWGLRPPQAAHPIRRSNSPRIGNATL